MRVRQGRVKRIVLSEDEVKQAAVDYVTGHSNLLLDVATHIDVDVSEDKSGHVSLELTCVYMGEHQCQLKR